MVDPGAGRELCAVQEVSLFAGFTRRWVRIACNRLADRTMLEAKLCGVGLLDPGREVLVSAHGLENDEKESRGPTTGAASVTKAG